MAKRELPQRGNPVWIYPTVRTDFALMQAYLDDLISRAAYTATLDPQNEEYVNNMLDMHAGFEAIQTDIFEACHRLCQ